MTPIHHCHDDVVMTGPKDAALSANMPPISVLLAGLLVPVRTLVGREIHLTWEIQGYFVGSLKQALLSIMIGMMIPLMINILRMGWNWKSSATHFKTPLCDVCLSSDVLQA